MRLPQTAATVLTASIFLGCASTSTPGTGTVAPAAAASSTSNDITEADLRQRLFIYAADSMEGRATATAGHVRATNYIARELQRLGVEPGGENGTYFQAVPVMARALDSTRTVSVDGTPLVYWRDLLPRDQGSALRSMDNAQVVYGGDVAEAQSLISDQAAAGKVVLLRNETPSPTVNRLGVSLRLPSAAGIMIVSLDKMPAELIAQLREPTIAFNPAAEGANVVPSFGYITRAAADRMFGAPVTSAAIGATGKTIRGTIAFTTRPTTYPVRNVIGIVRGSDPTLRTQYVSVSAHSDHVGILPVVLDHDSVLVFNRLFRRGGLEDEPPQLNESQMRQLRAARDSIARIRPPRRDSINNGADDDGSGSMGLLELAEYFSHASQKPKRSIIFIWQTSEEMGLWGSEWFTDHPTVPRDSIVANVNIDMIGRGSKADLPQGGDDYLQILGSRRVSTEYGDMVERVNARPENKFRLDYTFDAPNHPQQYYCRSDHWNYGRYGIPTVFLSTGGHPDYHQVTDEPQYISYPHYAHVVRFVSEIVSEAAAMPTRPKVDKPIPGPRAQCRQ